MFHDVLGERHLALTSSPEVACRLDCQSRMLLEHHGVTPQILNWMEELIGHLRRSEPNAFGPELIDIPEEEQTPKWDL